MATLDPQALHQLYSENNSWLKGWLRARLGNAADASDLAHYRRRCPALARPRRSGVTC